MNYYLISKSIIVAALIGLTIALLPFSFTGASSGRPQSTMLNVPYTTQAPFGEWSDPRQADGCEEASLVMAMAWARGGGNVPAEEAKRDIINLSEYERVRFGYFQDTSILSTSDLLHEYYGYKNYMVQYGITSEDIKNELAGGHVVVIPINTRLLGTDFYKNGPVRHTVVAIGYDDQADTITFHDPYHGGQFMTVHSSAVNAALWDYYSGVHLPSPPKVSAMLVIYR